MAFKMKGSPMYRNFGVSPMKVDPEKKINTNDPEEMAKYGYTIVKDKDNPKKSKLVKKKEKREKKAGSGFSGNLVKGTDY